MTTAASTFADQLDAQRTRLGLSDGGLAELIAKKLKDYGLGRLHRVTVNGWLQGHHEPTVAEQKLILDALKRQRAPRK